MPGGVFGAFSSQVDTLGDSENATKLTAIFKPSWQIQGCPFSRT
jgi:hypothetical protein